MTRASAAGTSGLQLADRAERVLPLLADDLLVRRAGERHLAGEQVVERRPEGEDVAAAVHEVRVHRLLVGHVVRRADALVDGGQLRVVVEPLGQAEVGELRDAVRVEQDVVRLHVAVDVLAVVEEVEGAGDVDPDPHATPTGSRPRRGEAACAVGPSMNSSTR